MPSLGDRAGSDAHVKLSVEPAADFGNGHGELVLEPCRDQEPGHACQVTVLQADRVVYIAEDWYDRIKAGQVPWAVLRTRNPWDLGILKIRHADGQLIYEVTGTVGPRVPAYLAEQPD